MNVHVKAHDIPNSKLTLLKFLKCRPCIWIILFMLCMNMMRCIMPLSQSFGPVDNGINAIAPKKSEAMPFLQQFHVKFHALKILVKQNIIQEQSQFLDSPTHSIQIHQSILTRQCHKQISQSTK